MTLLASGSPSVNRSPASSTPQATDFQWAFSRLHSPWWRDRVEALGRLAEAGAPAELIARSFQDRFPEVRLAAIAALERATESELPIVTNHLLSAFDDPDPRVVGAAIYALKVRRVEQARQEIIAVLDDWCLAAAARPGEHHPFCIAKAAVGYLAELGPSEVAEHFLPLLNLHGLLWWKIRSLARWGIRCLRCMPAIPALIEAVERLAGQESRSEADTAEARSCILLLGELRARAAVPILLRVAREAVKLRSNAVEALTEIDPTRAAEDLIDMLADPGSRLRHMLLVLMSKAASPTMLPRIRPMLADGSYAVRSAALQVLARLEDLESADEVRRLCISDPSPDVRSVAVEACVTILREGAIPTLEALANDTNASIRQRARKHLERLRSGATELTPMGGQDLSPGDDRQQRGEESFPEPAEPHSGSEPAMCPRPGLHTAGASARERTTPFDATPSIESIG
jgi:HEAT repeat protein